MSGPTLISRIIPRVSKTFWGRDKSKARVSMARLAEGWEEVVAPEDPSQVMPVRIGWKSEGEGANKKSFGTLHMVAPSALAAKILYQEAVIVQRVNRLFGLSGNVALTRIAITHDKAQAYTPRRFKKQGTGRLDTDTAMVLAEIEDPVLRERLESLARSMTNK